MSKSADNLMSYLRTVSGAWRNDPRDDTELLACFAQTRSEAAFATLVGRHGALVWRTCRSILGNTSDAEDAFQTTFLAMSRKIDLISIANLAGWLHKVARRTALNVQVSVRRNQKHEEELRTIPRSENKEKDSQAELYAAIDEELVRLPERLRVPLLLRYLEGKTLEEVARTVGCSRPALGKRLTKGEAALRERLEKRGLTLGVASVAILLRDTACTPAMPARLIESTAQAAVAFRGGSLSGQTAEGAHNLLRALAREGVVKKLWWAVLACIGTLWLGGGGWVAWKMFGGSDAVTPSVPESPKAATTKIIARPHNGRVDRYGDPLPEGAIARIGTTRFRFGGGGSWFEKDAFRYSNLQAEVALSSDGKTLVVADGWRGICFWDAVTGKELRKVAMNCKQVAFSSDGKRLAVHYEDENRGVRVLDVATAHQVGVPLRGGASVFTSDGKTIACACENSEGGSFYLYDVGTTKLLRKLGREVGARGEYYLTCAQFSRDSRCLVCAYESETHGHVVDLLDVETGKTLATLMYSHEVAQLVLSPSGDIITSEMDRVIRVRDAKTGKELRQLGPMEHVPTVLAFLPDGKTLLAACTGKIRFWDAATGQEVRNAVACPGLVHPILLSVDGTKLIEQVNGAVSIWDVTTGKETDPAAGAPRFSPCYLAFSPDGTRLATTIGSQVGRPLQELMPFNLWESDTGKLLSTLPLPADTIAVLPGKITWPSHDTILAVGTFAIEGPLHSMVRWKITPSANAAVGEALPWFDGAYVLSPDARVIVRRDQGLELFDVATGKKLSTMPYSEFDGAMAFSADHQILATQLCRKEKLSNEEVTLWETATGHRLYSLRMPAIAADRLEGLPDSDRLIGFTPDNRLLATYNPETFAISLWERVSGRLRLCLPGPKKCKHERPGVAFSPNSRLLAIGYGSTVLQEESSIHIWDLTTGHECQCFRGHNGATPEVIFSPDGRRLASAGDYTALIWGVKPPSMPEKASQLLSREELQALRAALAGQDAQAAYRAMGKLRQLPEQAVPLAAECLHPRPPTPETERISQQVHLLVASLDSDDFQTRSRASQELRKQLESEMGEPLIQCLLGEALSSGKLAVEVSRTISQLLSELKEERKLGGAKSSELTRMCRAIELLEWVHTDAAREVLQQVTLASPRPEVGHETMAALKRMANLSPALTP